MAGPKKHKFPAWPDWLMWGHFLKGYKAVTDRVDKRLSLGSDLSLAEFELMYVLNQGGGRVRFIDLANITLLSQSRISRQIDSLQARGMLVREITDSNRRATYAVLTPQGKASYDQAEQVFLEGYYTEFRNLIPEEDLAAFQRVLGILLQEPDYPQQSLRTLEAAFEINSSGPRVLPGRKPSKKRAAKIDADKA